MKIAAVFTAFITIAAGALPATAQFVPPAPGRTAPTPEYTPPAPPPIPPPRAPDANPPTPAPPPAPEKPLPSLVERDDQGRVKPLKVPLYEAAVRALEMDDESKAKVDAALAARHKELDRIVANNIPLLMELRTVMARVDEKTDLEEMRAVTNKAKTFQPGTILDALTRTGALTPVQKTQAGKIARDFTTAYKSDVADRVGKNNMMAAVPVLFKIQVDEYASEGWQSLDRQLAAAAGQQEELLKGLTLPAPQAADVNKRLGALKGKPPASEQRVEVLRGIFFDVLNDEQRKAFLLAASPDLAAPPADDKTATPAPAPAAPGKK